MTKEIKLGLRRAPLDYLQDFLLRGDKFGIVVTKHYTHSGDPVVLPLAQLNYALKSSIFDKISHLGCRIWIK